MSAFDAVLPYVPYITPVITAVASAVAGYAVANRTARSNEKIARIAHAEQVEKTVKAEDALSTNAMTKRFQVLLDGYESHIKDLTAEVQGLRTEVQQLRAVLACSRPDCALCLFREQASG